MLFSEVLSNASPYYNTDNDTQDNAEAEENKVLLKYRLSLADSRGEFAESAYMLHIVNRGRKINMYEYK